MDRYSAVAILLFWMNVTVAQTEKTIPFLWSNDSLNGIFFEKTAIHIPVKFKNDTTVYYFQFDTGANKSYLYTGEKSDLSIIRKINTEVNLTSSIGQIILFPKTSNSTYKKNDRNYIGTIGSDYLSDKIVEIDFVNQKINILNDYSELDYHIEHLKLTRGRPTINFAIEGKNYSFLFDTGSSLFDMWTTKRLWKKWKEKDSEIMKFPISSWGKINTSFRAKVKDSIFENSKIKIDLNYIWYNSNKKFQKMFRQANVSGIIGNKPFLEDILLLDFRNSKIAIRKTNKP